MERLCPTPRWGLTGLINPAECLLSLVLSVGVHTRSKSRRSSDRQKDAARGKGEGLFFMFAKAQLQTVGLRYSEGGANSEMRGQPGERCSASDCLVAGKTSMSGDFQRKMRQCLLQRAQARSQQSVPKPAMGCSGLVTWASCCPALHAGASLIAVLFTASG